MIALYIDLRLYDKACTDGESIEVKYEIALEIHEQYLSDEALSSQMDIDDLNKSYFPVTLE